ncbi:hypothetical protein PF003_g12443 [Phytophthora fragariae]|nr:hypothetical protein PF003_g12443 [Phytophthora fragariae]
MPRVVGVSVGLIARIFLMLTTSTAYSAVGCHIMGNLLLTIYRTELTTLGFALKWGGLPLRAAAHHRRVRGHREPGFYIAKRHAQEKTARPRELRELRGDCHAKREPRRSSKMSVDDAENEHKGGV